MQITSTTTLADLAVHLPGASRVFHRHGLDFCCHGQVALEDACRERGLEAQSLLAELEATCSSAPEPAVGELGLAELVEYVLEHFHAAHREELPRLIAMARKVEDVHAGKSECPRGLAAHLERMAESLELHMQKEEQILFPQILAGRGRHAAMPISVTGARSILARCEAEPSQPVMISSSPS